LRDFTSVNYKCVLCGYVGSKKEWEQAHPRLEEWEIREREKRGIPYGSAGGFKCPMCGYRVAKKLRPPVVKRVRCK